MENEVSMGMNRTGARMAPPKAEAIENFAQSRLGQGRRDGEEVAALRQQYVREADRVGAVPIPGTAKGALEAAVSQIKGDKPSLLVDKLGERLAFERSGVRLYETLIMKCTALQADSAKGFRVPLDELAEIRADEESHFELLTGAIVTLGADPTAMTPSADVAGVSAMGWLQVVSDPRTTIAQALTAMFSAELTDTASWELLVELATASGQNDMVKGFTAAADAERRHVMQVRQWLAETVLGELR